MQCLCHRFAASAVPLPDPHLSPVSQGFVQYAGAHESLMLDVDTLNEQLKHSGAIRLRHAMKPDEAYGMIFNFDSVVADISAVQHQAWRQLAQQHSLPFPAIPRPEVLSMSPEYNIIQTFRWTNNRKEAQALAYDLAIITSDILNTLTEPHHGVRDWLVALTNFNVPCALVSRLDRATVRRVLERMCLHDYFTTMVTSEDDMETISQRLLSAAIKLHRPPNLCVLLDASPEGVTAAHNCTMKAIAVAGQYKAYQLKMADLTCASLGGLTVYNIRRLFANRGAEFMDVKHGFSNDKPPSTRRVAAAVMD